MYEEQLSIFGEEDLLRDATYQEMQDMKYLDLFIKESQRLIPAVPFIGRQAHEDFKLGIIP